MHTSRRSQSTSSFNNAYAATICLSLILAACNTPQVVNVPAADLDARCNVTDISENPSDGKVIVVLQLLQNGNSVQVDSSATCFCNGVALTYNGLLFGYAERVPLQPVGGHYHFRFTRGAVNTDADVVVPARPVFAPPTVAAAALARSNAFTINYVAGSGTSVRGGANDASNSRNNSQADDGTHDGLDTSAFVPGPGTLSITRTLEQTIPGTGFHSAMMHYDTNKTIAITWL